MFLRTPEIVWHGKEPIFSLDFQQCGETWRLASAGADHTIKIWKVDRGGGGEGNFDLQFLSSLDRHTKSVNVVRFSPNGSYLASGSDDCMIIIWQLNCKGEGGVVTEGTLNPDETNKENWTVYKMLRGHIEDVYDLSWSLDSSYLISGSVDNTAIIWNVTNGEKLSILKESHHYIQGVAWDPSNSYLATLGTDRSLRLYNKLNNDKYKCVFNISKMSEDPSQLIKCCKMFHDESMSSFFRRLSFSPDGNLLVAPGGRVEVNDKAINVSWVFTRSSLPKPVLYLPCSDKPSVMVKFCPILFELREESQTAPSLIDLPYRMIFAILTLQQVIIYDTQQSTPIGYVSDIHYASLTDATWSADGSILIVSSSDGFCSFLSFSPGELGTPLSSDKYPSILTNPGHLTTPTHHTPTNEAQKPIRRITPIRIDTPTSQTTTPTNKKKARRVELITL